MKKIFKMVVFATMLLVVTNAGAQNIGNLLKKAASAVTSSDTTSSSSSSSSSNLLSGLSSIFSSALTATEDQIIGTWTYSGPAVVFEDSNVLKQLGGTVASATIENKLATYYEKVGITEGKMSMTFDSEGNFSQTIMGKTLKGTYTIDDKNVNLKYSVGISQFAGTTQLNNGNLDIVMDATKLLSLISTISSLTGNATASSLGSLLGSYDGMEIGFKFKK